MSPVYSLVYPAVWPNLGLHFAALAKLALLLLEEEEYAGGKCSNLAGAADLEPGKGVEGRNCRDRAGRALEALEAARAAVSILEVTHGARRGGIGLQAGPGALGQAEYSLAEARAWCARPT